MVNGALLSTMFGTVAPVFADTTDSTTTVSQTQNSSELPNEHISITKENANTYVVTVTNNGNTLVATETNDGTNVTTDYVLNGKSIYTNVQSTSAASQFGDQQKSDIANQNFTNIQPSTTQAVSPMGIPVGDYMFDGKVYKPASANQPYAHPDRSYYGVSPYTNWSQWGTNFMHAQINEYDSSSILGGASWAIGGAIGAALGAMFTLELGPTVVGGIIGSFLGAIDGGQIQRLADEDDCIWVTLDNNPTYVNEGSAIFPEYYWDVRYIEVGPWSGSNYLYYVGGAGL